MGQRAPTGIWNLPGSLYTLHFIYLFFFCLKERFCYKAQGERQGGKALLGAMSPTKLKEEFLSFCGKQYYNRRRNQCSTVLVH